MRSADGRRTLPTAREVEKVHRYLKTPKTIVQISVETRLEPTTVSKAIRILQYTHRVIEVDCDPETYMEAVA